MNDILLGAMYERMSALENALKVQNAMVIHLSELMRDNVLPCLDKHSGNIADIGDAMLAFNNCLQALVGKQAPLVPRHLTVVVDNSAAGD